MTIVVDACLHALSMVRVAQIRNPAAGGDGRIEVPPNNVRALLGQKEGIVSDHESSSTIGTGQGGGKHDRPTEQAVYTVNDRKGLVGVHGEELPGKEILSRVGLSFEKYELFTVVDGKTGDEIKPDQVHRVKPGDHFRATIRGTDYSTPRAMATGWKVSP